MSKRDIAFKLQNQAKQKVTRQIIYVYGKNDKWRAGLVEMIQFSKKNKGYKMSLNVLQKYNGQKY